MTAWRLIDRCRLCCSRPPAREHGGLEVIDTVERLQGQQREIIIYSLCASDRKYAISRAQFLYSPNRLNVAITRSRTKLFVVGSKYFFPHINGIIIDAQHMRTWESYFKYLVENGCRVK